MPKSYLRGLTQREEKQEGVDFFAHLQPTARMLAFQFKAPQRGPEAAPYRYTLVREQHELLFGLAELAPGSVFYVLPFYVTPTKLQQRVPNLAQDTWLLPVAQMPTTPVFGAQATKVIRCSAGTALVNPEYRLAMLAQAPYPDMRGVPVREFAHWYAQHREIQTASASRRNPWLVRGLRVAVVHGSEEAVLILAAAQQAQEADKRARGRRVRPLGAYARC